MTDILFTAAETAAAGMALLLMGIGGARLLMRLVRLMRTGEGWESHAPRRQFAPAQMMLAAAGAALVSRVLIYLTAYGMYRLLGVGCDGFFASLEPLWTHWDTRHYTGIALEGYTSVGDERLRLVFFPLYPLLMRLLSPLTMGSVFASGLLISLLCSCISAALIFDLTCMHCGREKAALAVMYFLLSPLSVFLCCVYTEALFIALTLMAICLMRRNRPYAAAVCGMLSAFTRMPGVIVSGLIIIALLEKAANRQFTLRAALECAVQVLIVFGGLFAYWLVNDAVTGAPLTYMTYQKENWFQEPGSFWASTANTVHYFLDTVGEGDWLYTWGFQLLCMLVIYLMMAFCTKALPFDLAAYSFVYVAVVLAPTWLLSGARYLYALCTFPMMLANLRLGRRGHALLAAVHALLLIIWIFGYTIDIRVL